MVAGIIVWLILLHILAPQEAQNGPQNGIKKSQKSEEARPGPQRAALARPRQILKQFWLHFGVISASFWCHFWYFLGHRIDFPVSPAFSQQVAAKSAHSQAASYKSISTQQQAESHQAQQASRVAVFKWVGGIRGA